ESLLIGSVWDMLFSFNSTTLHTHYSPFWMGQASIRRRYLQIEQLTTGSSQSRGCASLSFIGLEQSSSRVSSYTILRVLTLQHPARAKELFDFASLTLNNPSVTELSVTLFYSSSNHCLLGRGWYPTVIVIADVGHHSIRGH
ncbi:hypothetical protein OTU49_008817, partial [Cherax quadricarinatus]